MKKSPELLVVFNNTNSDEERIEALKLYQIAFNAKSVYDLEPDESGELHIVMDINGYKFGLFPGDGYVSNWRSNICCQFEYDTEDELRKTYEILSREAQEHSIETDFWCKIHAMVIDKFGVVWSLVYS